MSHDVYVSYTCLPKMSDQPVAHLSIFDVDEHEIYVSYARVHLVVYQPVSHQYTFASG